MTRAASTKIRVEDVEDEFHLDLRVIESAGLLSKVQCDTSDGCGETCSGSACNSSFDNPS